MVRLDDAVCRLIKDKAPYPTVKAKFEEIYDGLSLLEKTPYLSAAACYCKHYDYNSLRGFKVFSSSPVVTFLSDGDPP
jgi:hypothetical protein